MPKNKQKSNLNTLDKNALLRLISSISVTIMKDNIAELNKGYGIQQKNHTESI